MDGLESRSYKYYTNWILYSMTRQLFDCAPLKVSVVSVKIILR